jgi:hypothetical protein
MFEQKRLCGDGAYAARAEQLCAGDQHVDGQDDEMCIERTIPSPLAGARLHSAGGLRNTTNSPPQESRTNILTMRRPA